MSRPGQYRLFLFSNCIGPNPCDILLHLNSISWEFPSTPIYPSKIQTLAPQFHSRADPKRRRREERKAETTRDYDVQGRIAEFSCILNPLSRERVFQGDADYHSIERVCVKINLEISTKSYSYFSGSLTLMDFINFADINLRFQFRFTNIYLLAFLQDFRGQSCISNINFSEI